MHRKIDYEDWEKTHGTAALVARDLRVRADSPPVHLEAPPTLVTHLRVPEDVNPVELAMVIVGRQKPHSGELVVGGLLLPEQGGAVQSAAAYVEVGRPGDERQSLSEQVHDRARLTTSSRRSRAEFVALGTALADDLVRAAATVDGHAGPLGRSAVRAAAVEAALAVAGGAPLLVLIEEGPESHRPCRDGGGPRPEAVAGGHHGGGRAAGGMEEATDGRTSRAHGVRRDRGGVVVSGSLSSPGPTAVDARCRGGRSR